ncbi:hypothetical protein Ocin01_09651 [Orchesella cincta]|uniref:Uncharacterized protein n=1 Tax=Orchesella cincta TaxID=48709 RepID=A0A1D2MVC7_ORCCI|nr:hypothetical protein Ocin01_09651 [Orchesella cincta]
MLCYFKTLLPNSLILGAQLLSKLQCRGPSHIISNANSNGGSPHHAHFKENLGRLKVYQTNSDATARADWRRSGTNGHHNHPPSNIGISKYREQ